MRQQAFAAGTAALVLGAWTSFGAPASARTELRDLATVEELRTRFEADGGRTRLVLLLSPT
jgi:hypothetical protein